jgi:hypothetical protein
MNEERQIEAWLKKEMTEDECAVFERKLALDPDLALAVEQHQKLMEDLQEIGLRRKIMAASAANQRLMHKRKLVFIFLLIAFLGGLGFLFSIQWGHKFDVPKELAPEKPILQEEKKDLNPVQNPNKNAPIEQKNIPKPTTSPIAKAPIGISKEETPLFRGVEDDATIETEQIPLFKEVFNNYQLALADGGSFSGVLNNVKEGNLTETRAKLLNLSKNDTTQYLLAVAALKSMQPEVASQSLTFLYRSDCVFRQESEWLMGLKWLLQGKEEEAEQAFKSIAGKIGHPHSEDAKTILKKIKN